MPNKHIKTFIQKTSEIRESDDSYPPEGVATINRTRKENTAALSLSSKTSEKKPRKAVDPKHNQDSGMANEHIRIPIETYSILMLEKARLSVNEGGKLKFGQIVHKYMCEYLKKACPNEYAKYKSMGLIK
jgi:hypothetical protein